MELVHAKLDRGKNMAQQDVFQLALVFGSPIRNADGASIGAGKTVYMSMMAGMPPEDFATGLRQLADHIEADADIMSQEGVEDGELRTDSGSE